MTDLGYSERMKFTKSNEFLLKIAIVAVAIFAMVALLVMRIKISELNKELVSLENEISSYKEQIDELDSNADFEIEKTN